MPRSASRSKSISNISAGYPVRLATICTMAPARSPSTGTLGLAVGSAGTSTLAVRSGSGPHNSGCWTAIPSIATIESESPSTTRKVRDATSKDTCSNPLTRLSHCVNRSIEDRRLSPWLTLRNMARLSCEPNPAARRSAKSRSWRPPFDRLMVPNSGSGSFKLAMGGTTPYCKAFRTTASSTPAPMGWPVKPFVFAINTDSACAPNATRSA